MFNMPLLLETALLMLAAFLLGAAFGTALRWFVGRARSPAVVPAMAAAAAGPAAAPLVVAPDIAPVGARPSVADRIAAAAEGRSAAQPVAGMSASVAMPRTTLPDLPALLPIQPSRSPGETVAGRHIDNPQHAAAAPPQADATPAGTPVEAALPAAIEPAVTEPAVSPAVAAAPEAEGVAQFPITEPPVAEPALAEPPAEAPAAAQLAPVLDATQAEHLELVQSVGPEGQGPAPAPEPLVLHVEPTLAPEDVTIVDGPLATARAIQETHPLAEGASAPAVQAESPLVEPDVERQAAEADETLLDRVDPEPEPGQPSPSEPENTPQASPPEPPAVANLPPVREPTEAEAELAAMRAIERGWTPRPSAAPRVAADLPEGVSVGETEAADRAVANAGAAVASAAARAAAILNDIAPSSQAEPSGAAEIATDPATLVASAVVEAQPIEPAPDLRPGRAPGGFGRPPSLEAPRQGTRDDLELIRGISPTIQSALYGLGIYHFDQIADWDQKAVVWVENHFGFKGRIARERWLEQARDLARGRPAVARPVRR